MQNRNNGGPQLGQGQSGPFDLTNIDNYEKDYELDWQNKIEKILETPSIDDMAGVFIRGSFKNERQLNAHLRLAYRHSKFKNKKQQELLRAKVLGSAAINGVSRLEALFAAVNLLASDMYRAVKGMPKADKERGDRVMRGPRGSDFQGGAVGTPLAES